jgi:ATP-binding protein involved in chromosome partitioning
MNKDEIIEKLKGVKYPGFTKDIVAFGFVSDVLNEDGIISIKLNITSSAPEVSQQLTDDIKAILGGDVKLMINRPKAPKETSSRGKNIASQIKNFVMVSSGKGGVGKSTTTVNLAVAMAMQGKKVGLLDADIYGPNIPRMMDLRGKKPETKGDKLIPLNNYGIEVISMGNLLEEGQSLIWRGAMIMKAIEQLLRDIAWSELDVLFIDMPPGTGDAQLTLAQSVPVTAGIVVTTPQKVSLDDTERSLDMFKKLHIPIAGVVENMSGFICPDTGKEYDIFGKGTSDPLAQKFDTKTVAYIPIEPSIRIGGDDGKPITYFEPESKSAKEYLSAASALWDEIERINKEDLATNEMIQPIPSTTSACSTAAASTPPKQDSGSCGTGCGCH